jgi:hypothetical protein
LAPRQPDDATLQVIAQLKEHLELLIDSNDRRYTLRDDYQKEALRVALESNERRLGTMNGFRSALADQSSRMITRAESDIARNGIMDKADEATKAINLRIDAEIRPMQAKLEEFGRPNWMLLASLISITFVMIAGIWLVIGLKIDASLVPVSLAVENLKVSGATMAETVRHVDASAGTSTQADVVSRSDRAQLNGRLQVVEGLVSSGAADRRAAQAATGAQLIEIETQFKSSSVVLNIQKDDVQRVLGLLWASVFPGSTLPQSNYRPNLYKEN